VRWQALVQAETAARLQIEIEATHSEKGSAIEEESARFKAMLDECNAKHKRKLDEVKASAERHEMETRTSFDQVG
jgi:hypothetical protein